MDHVDQLRPQPLSQRVIRADDAVRCCESGYIRASVDAANMVAEFLEALLSEDEGEGLALVAPGVILPGLLEAPATNPRIIKIPSGSGLSRGLGVGAVLLVSATSLARIARQTGALEATSAILEALVQVRTKAGAKENCEKCVRSKILSQENLRHYEFTKVRRRT